MSLVLLSLWATKALTAPLSRFADAAEQFGRDFEHRMLPEQGPEEIRKASRAFNQMGARIKRLVEDRTNMLAAISHDLRTPITRLRLRTEFVEDEKLRSDMLNDLEQLTEMVKSTLAFLRDSRLEEEMTNFDLGALLRKVCGQFDEMGKEVTYNGEEHKVISGRPDAISRAVVNLIENALKFGTKANVILHSLSDGSVAIDVLDDGPGITDPDPARLLRPFVRGDDARTLTPQSGFGLGLTIANSIVEAHGGQLTLTNRKPCGLAVRLQFAGNSPSGWIRPAQPPRKRNKMAIEVAISSASGAISGRPRALGRPVGPIAAPLRNLRSQWREVAVRLPCHRPNLVVF